jgi:N-acetylmuramoyl-L-alanine amidase
LLAASPAISRAAQLGNSRTGTFAHAERLREALEGRPEQQRTRLQYEHVLDAYRAIYHADPGSSKADASIAAVADLLAEEGRVFQDDKALHDAIGQDEFLRHQYPGSRYRFSALLTEGEIYQRDLGDPERARVIYESFVRQYPRSPLAVEAHVELKKIRQDEMAGRRSQPATRAGGRSGREESASSKEKRRESSREEAESGSESSGRSGRNSGQLEEQDLPAPDDAASGDTYETARENRQTVADHPESEENAALMNALPPPRRGKLILITGIRHWTAPNYTRVVIDLQKVVNYQAARVPEPGGGTDRIFFDLYGTRLSPELVGRAVELTNDGFLTRIRAAQPSTNMTRIVLDVNGVSDYSAFFLQGPPRLIIDVHGNLHGRKAEAPTRQIASRGEPTGSQPGDARAAGPRMAGSRAAFAGNELERLRQTPATSTLLSSNAQESTNADGADGGNESGNDDSGALTDADTLNHQPDQVRATRHPTTQPVVSSFAGDSGGSNSGEEPSGTLQRAPSRGNKPSAALRAADDVPPAESGTPGIPAPPPANQRVPNSMVRALGLKINRIVIDAGHGGHDSGTLGPGGLEEKNVVLDVALRLGRMLRERLGADVIYTRTDDTFIPLETRTAIANQAQADLFISIHANSSPDTAARGVEVYYLNFTTSADALEVAARENAASDQSIHQLSDLVKKIALDDKINESRAFAEDVDQSLYNGLESGNPGLRDRGVKKAPFVVLIGANMPSILAEISFLTNPDDASELRDSAYRQRIAEALYRGVARYVSSLNGVRLAQAGSRTGRTE